MGLLMAIDNKLSSWLNSNIERCKDIPDIVALRDYIRTLPIFDCHEAEVHDALVKAQLKIENKQHTK